MINNARPSILPLDSIKNEQIKMILEYFGEEHQRIKACEELTELQVEIFHNSSEDTAKINDIYDKVVSEIADVYIMLEQVVKIYGILKSDIDKSMTLKLRRTEDRIQENKRSAPGNG